MLHFSRCGSGVVYFFEKGKLATTTRSSVSICENQLIGFCIILLANKLINANENITALTEVLKKHSFSRIRGLPDLMCQRSEGTVNTKHKRNILL